MSGNLKNPYKTPAKKKQEPELTQGANAWTPLKSPSPLKIGFGGSSPAPVIQFNASKATIGARTFSVVNPFLSGKVEPIRIAPQENSWDGRYAADLGNAEKKAERARALTPYKLPSPHEGLMRPTVGVVPNTPTKGGSRKGISRRRKNRNVRKTKRTKRIKRSKSRR